MNRRAPFTALLTAYVISLAATQISAIAIPWLVLTTTGSAAKTGLVGFATMAPYVAALEQDVLGDVLSASGAGGGDTEVARSGHESFGRAHRG